MAKRTIAYFASLNTDFKSYLHGNSSAGFTIIEWIVVVGIIGVLATIAFFGYTGYVDKARVVTVKNELNMLEKEIYAYGIDGPTLYPPDLAAVGYAGFLDPWQSNIVLYFHSE